MCGHGAVLAIFAAACATGLIFLSAFYGFRPVVFAKALRSADWLEIASPNLFQPGIIRASIELLPAERIGPGAPDGRHRGYVRGLEAGQVFRYGCALARRCSGIRIRFTDALFRIHLPVSGMPFLLLFMAGVSADLLESRYALAANAVVFGVLWPTP